jgi:hypothetical protein
LKCAQVGGCVPLSAVPFRLLEEETRAARERSPRLLRAAVVRLVIEGADEWRKDDRDFMVALAPLRHCAGVIGADATALFTEAAREVPDDLRDSVEAMGRRLDVTPAAFGFVFEETTEGPRYGFESMWTDDELALGPDELERRWMQRHGFHEP